MEKYMVEIDNVTKRYILGQIGGTTLHEELQRRRAKRLGKEDPTKKIGAKSYADGEEFWALGGVSFKVKKGERVGIIGHNGAGKSTLLKLLSRVTAPTSGEIGLDGRVTSMLEVGTGFHGELTGRENIYMNGAILGMTKAEIDSKIEDIIEFSEVRQFIDTPVKRYSSGMYVRLAFSVAAHLDSEIMIMDEVLAVGDMAFQKKCLDKMNGVSRTDGRTILYVSHNMNTIRQLCDRVIVLDHGKVVFDGEVEEGIQHYMGLNEIDLSLKKSFLNYISPPHVDGQAKIESVEILNRQDAFLVCGEMISVRIVWRTTIENKPLCIRLLLYRSDSVPAGMAISPNLNYKSGIENTHTFEWDVSLLAPGKYQAQLLICEIDEYGIQTLHECVNQAICFEINQNINSFHKLQWIPGWGGCCCCGCPFLEGLPFRTLKACS